MVLLLLVYFYIAMIKIKTKAEETSNGSINNLYTNIYFCIKKKTVCQEMFDIILGSNKFRHKFVTIEVL